MTGLARGPVRAIQPLEQARLQATPSALRQSDAALRYCERLLRTIPSRRFPDSADPRRPRFWQVFLNSPALYLALQVVAARSRVSTSTVLLAAWAVVLARVSGRNPAAVQIIVNNRFRPGFADVVSPISQSSLCVIDVADITLGEAVPRAWRSAMGAYKYAYYDARRRDEPVHRVSRERGEAIDIDCLLNDRRMQSRQEPDGSLPEPARVRAALPRSTPRAGDCSRGRSPRPGRSHRRHCAPLAPGQ